MSYRTPPEFILHVSFTSPASLPAFRRPDAGTIPYISGATLKGAIKATAERILGLSGIAHCSFGKQLDSCESKPCPICSLFGQRQSPGKIVFEGATLTSASGIDSEELRRHNRPQFRHKRVGSGEGSGQDGPAIATFAPLSFTARLVALYPLSGDEEQLLLSASESVRTLGRGKAQGLGFCSIEVERMEPFEWESLPKVEALEGEGNEVGVFLIAEGPILIAKSPVGQWYRESLDYVPGAVLKSAFFDQTKRLERLGVLGTEMVNAFLAPTVCFSDCLPIGSADSEFSQSEAEALELPFVLPFSAMSPDSRPCAGSDEARVPPDTLIRRLVVHECYENGLPYVIERDCPRRVFDQVVGSGSRTFWKGKLVSVLSDVVSFCPVERVSKRTITESRHRVSFAHPQTTFVGTIRKLRPAAKEALKRLAVERLSVGALRSRGFGRLSLRIVRPPSKVSVGEAVRRFNVAIVSELKRLGGAWAGASSINERIEREGRLYFSIGLLSDLMLPEWLFWDGDGTALEKLLSQAGITAREVFSLLKCGARGGWNAACQAPRGLAPIIRRGSVCLLETKAAGPARDGLLRSIQSIQDTGLGLRTNDGFGAVDICSGFHTIGYLES